MVAAFGPPRPDMEERNMAFNVVRFSTFSGGQSGAGILAKYDGSGAVAADGADNLAAIKADNYFTAQAVKDAVALASDGRTTGAGLPIMLQGTNGFEFDVLWDDSGTLKMRGGAFNLS